MSIAWDVYVDGSGTFHPNAPACVGVVVAANGWIMAELSACVGKGSNNVAELRAIQAGLELLALVHPLGRAGAGILYSDSTYAIGTAEGHYRAKINYELAFEVQETRREFPYVELQHVRGHAKDPGNELADWLAGYARARTLDALPYRRPRPTDWEWLELRPVEEVRAERLRDRRELRELQAMIKAGGF